MRTRAGCSGNTCRTGISLDLRSWGPYFDLHRGCTERALAEYARLFSDGHNDEEDLRIYVGALKAAGQFETAIAVLENFIASHGSLSAERWLGTPGPGRQAR